MPVCIFCGRERARLSDEHVFAAWLHEEFPPIDPTRENTRFIRDLRFREEPRVVDRTEGPMWAHSVVKKVCREEGGVPGCNDGWMSQLEKDVTPILTPLGHGARRHLSEDDQRLLSFWAAKTLMVSEYTDDATRTTSDAQRSALYQRRAARVIPHGFMVFASTRDAVSQAPLQFSRQTASHPQAEMPLKGVKKTNVQWTAFTIGAFVLVVVSSNLPGGLTGDPTILLQPRLERIHPFRREIDFPGAGCRLSDDDLRVFRSGDAFFRLLGFFLPKSL